MNKPKNNNTSAGINTVQTPEKRQGYSWGLGVGTGGTGREPRSLGIRRLFGRVRYWIHGWDVVAGFSQAWGGTREDSDLELPWATGRGLRNASVRLPTSKIQACVMRSYSLNFIILATIKEQIGYKFCFWHWIHYSYLLICLQLLTSSYGRDL